MPRKHGNLWFWRIGPIGGTFYIKRLWFASLARRLSCMQ